MHLDPATLFLIWFGGGFVILLAWATLVGQALMGDRPQVVRPAIGVLAVVGVFHPAAAASAIDLVRLGRTIGTAPGDDPSLSAGDATRHQRSAALALPNAAIAAVYGCAVLSVGVAVTAFIAAGGLP